MGVSLRFAYHTPAVNLKHPAAFQSGYHQLLSHTQPLATLELVSLADSSMTVPGQSPPASHSFFSVLSSGYWWATTNAGKPSLVCFVSFFNGSVFLFGKSDSHQVGCFVVT